jgi:hypothetical protein
MAKQKMAAQDLNAYLESEFLKMRSPECEKCVVPKPFWGPSAGLGPGYWYMKTAPECPHNCRQVIAGLWARVTTEYDIGSPQKDVVA